MCRTPQHFHEAAWLSQDSAFLQSGVGLKFLSYRALTDYCPSRRLLIAFLFSCTVLSGLSVFAQETSLREVGDLSLRVDTALEIESAVDPGLVKWPIVADWDAAGRLVIAESGGVAKPIVEHNKQKLHRIIRLVDSNGDGRFDKRIVAADQLAFPEGVLCVGNSILVSAPPQIWKLTDADGDGVCEQREVWYDPGTITGCANDLHGPYMGRDGWIYWCKGAFAEQHHTLVSGKELTTKASHIFRRRLEGGPVEPVMTGGMDNPVEMAISHRGERFFTSTFLQHPAAGKRDGIAHAVYGGVYGKQNDVINGHKRTGELMPIMTHLGPAAPSGLICLESSRLLGQDLASSDILVAAQFNLHKVTAHQLVPQGASFVTENRELVASERIDFHPTDILEAPDGSLLVIDTGGWYKLCCPSSGIDQSIAVGGIYRLTSNKTRQTQATKQLKLADAWSEAQAWKIAQDSAQPLEDRQAALWRICRLNTPTAQQKLLEGLQLPEPALRHIAAHAISVQRVPQAAGPLAAALTRESDAHAQRAMAEALGRLGSADSIPVLLAALARVTDDRMLEHSLLYALIELEQPELMLTHLKSSQATTRRAALVVLDQLGRSDNLTPTDVLPALTADHAALRQVASQIAKQHPDWANQYGAELTRAWQAALKQPELRSHVAEVIAAWSQTAAGSAAIAQQLNAASDAPAATQQALLETLAAIGNQPLPESWLAGLQKLLERGPQADRLAWAAWLAKLKTDGTTAAAVRQTVIQLAQEAPSTADKLRWLAAIPAGSVLEPKELEGLVIQSLLADPATEANSAQDLSSAAATALARLQLSPAAAEQLITGLARVQPLHLMLCLTSISSLKQDELDSRALTRLMEVPAARTLPLEQVTTLFRSRSESLRTQARTVVETLGKPPADVEAKLDSLLAQLTSGDAARGFQVFRSSKAACSACHRIGYVGGQIGPDLTRIGATRSRRALLEAIVFPSARLEQSYTPLRVLTSDGRVFNGMVARDSGGSLELITSATERVTLAHDEIEQRLPSAVSIMPAGLEQQLSMSELADLLTLLESAR